MVSSKYARSTDLKFNLNRYRIIEMDHSKERAEDNQFIESIKDTLLGKGSWAKRLAMAATLVDSAPKSEYVQGAIRDIREIVKANRYIREHWSSSQEYNSFSQGFNFSETMVSTVTSHVPVQPSPLESSLSNPNILCTDPNSASSTYKFSPEPKGSPDLEGSIFSKLERGGVIIKIPNPNSPEIADDHLNELIAHVFASGPRWRDYQKSERELKLAQSRASRPMGTRIFEAGKRVAAVLGVALGVTALAVSSLSFTPMPKYEDESHVPEVHLPYSNLSTSNPNSSSSALLIKEKH